MQIGMIGLGRMGGNIVRRLTRNGHQCVVFDQNPAAIKALVGEHIAGSADLKQLVGQLKKPRAVWLMLPAGRITEETVERLGGLLEADDIIIDGGNSFYKDDIRRAKALAEKGIRYVDCGTSGGVWGIDRGYCMMIGGQKAAVDHLDPIFSALAPGLGDIARTPGRENGDTRAERGYIHAGPSGAGHFVKMVHNGIEYGLMQAYAEGFDILRQQGLERSARGRALHAEHAGYRGSLAARQRHLILAARSRRRCAGEGSAIEGFLRLRSGFGRGPLDRRSRDRGSGSGQRAYDGAVHPIPLAAGAHLRRQDALRHAPGLRRPRRGTGAHRSGAEAEGSIDGTARRRVATMLDNPPTKLPKTAQVIASPPRRQAKPADPCTMVIFGASGDLTKRLVVPALYNLARTKVLPEKFALIGVALSERTTESWRDHLYGMLKSFVGNAAAEFDVDHIDEAVWKQLAEKMTYVQGDLTKPELYEKLRGVLDETEKAHGTQGNVIFYLAVADQLFGTVVEQLGKAKLTDQNDDQNGKHRFWRRVVIEKPFGHSLNSARALNTSILRTLHEDQIFRIDHFLGKDTVQSITAFRFANGLFEPIWNRDRIDHVQITAAETVGVERRGKFYEVTGALRDMVPNHVFSLLSLVAMEPPVGFDDASIRTKKADVFAAMPAIKPAQAVRGQYGTGTVLGKNVKAYRQEPERGAGFERRNLRRHADRDRQLALGRRALLCPHRQAHVATKYGDRNLLQAGALCRVPGHARRHSAAQLAGAEHRARRGNLLAVRGQASRARGGSRRREDAILLRRLVPERTECRIRDAAL